MFGWIGTAVGALILLWAIFMIFFFPAMAEHQTDYFGKNGLIFGFVLLLVGVLLVFF